MGKTSPRPGPIMVTWCLQAVLSLSDTWGTCWPGYTKLLLLRKSISKLCWNKLRCKVMYTVWRCSFGSGSTDLLLTTYVRGDLEKACVTVQLVCSSWLVPTVRFSRPLGIEENMQEVVGHITEGVCRPLKVGNKIRFKNYSCSCCCTCIQSLRRLPQVRIEQVIVAEPGAVLLYKLSNLLKFYHHTIR